MPGGLTPVRGQPVQSEGGLRNPSLGRRKLVVAFGRRRPGEPGTVAWPAMEKRLRCQGERSGYAAWAVLIGFAFDHLLWRCTTTRRWQDCVGAAWLGAVFQHS